ncbi:uncharacterized protein RCC_07469 [Ramularia collo-cygni]|uniref:Wings apart-like protein C-terminal domain-containing protein n=1 Tax=Ramularia collo-cygni TaxID=112498 RepID=A0A2D3V4J2_9PEZI|nr:uncharacterized protein RCC_07469 [Ramularia collo-cygni]CZT21605.1 uncharacterized protein RCC_07469 [Ramularia collo-cygni]
MAAVSRRRKQATYGKPSRSVNTWNSGNLNALDEDELPIVEPTTSRSAGVMKSYSVQKRETKPKSPRLKAKPSKSRAIKEDIWDVPSSESSEDDISPVKRQSVQKLGGKGRSERGQEDVQLAPWEKAKVVESGTARRDDIGTSGRGVVRAIGESEQSQTVDSLVPLADSPSRESATPPVQPSPKSSSAAARLQAKRRQSGHVVTTEASKPCQPFKRTAQGGPHTVMGPRKRLRSNKTEGGDILMDDVSVPSCDSHEMSISSESPLHGTLQKPETGGGGADVSTATAAISETNQAANPRRNRRGNLTTHSSPRKGVSAPARLNEMLPVDADNTDDTRSTLNTDSTAVTPDKNSDARYPASPQTAFRTGATKNQSHLLNELLHAESAVPSPSALPMQALKITSTRRGPGGMASRMLPKSSSDVGRPRTKLVDRLKASAESSDEGTSEEDITDASDVEMNDAGDREDVTPEGTQSHSQATAANSRPKFTYAASQVTWLKEESLEEELMLNMPTDSQHRPKITHWHGLGNSNSTSQKESFEMEDSDDEGAAGRLRTIHELRAGGINRRFMDDISGLLEDVANHNIKARSRRRSALIDVANKLTDKSFAAKFYTQGFEQQLLSECVAPPDDIADFALAVAIVVILAGAPPEHTAQSLKDGGALSLLVRMLSNRTDPKKLVKERRNNMSKGAQSDFLHFIGRVTEQQAIWGDAVPTLVTSRTISLRALDLLAAKLRRAGDQSEILSHDSIQEVLFSQTEIDLVRSGDIPAEVTLSMSLLESLSTTTINLAWPAELTKCLGNMVALPILVNDKAQKLRFLTLRLCLHLTNGNQRNCKAFAGPDTVVALLQSMANGFEALSQDQEESQRTISLDLLVLTMGIMINLTEQRSSACEYAATEEAVPVLSNLVGTFLKGQQRTLEAESVEDGVTNVAFGYLAVVLANLCRYRETRHIIASRLPGKKLERLVEAVHEFVLHHQKVDNLNFEGEEGTAVWSSFTEKLNGILSRLSAEAEADEIDRR